LAKSQKFLIVILTSTPGHPGLTWPEANGLLAAPAAVDASVAKVLQQLTSPAKILKGIRVTK
jgi:hypothetical protein